MRAGTCKRSNTSFPTFCLLIPIGADKFSIKTNSQKHKYGLLIKQVNCVVFVQTELISIVKMLDLFIDIHFVKLDVNVFQHVDIPIRANAHPRL